MNDFDFETLPDRAGLGAAKWIRHTGGQSGHPLIPMWVADMDLPGAPCVVQAVENAARCGAYGYTDITDEYRDAVCGFMKRRHSWEIAPEWIVPQNGVVPAISVAVRAFTEPGDHVLTMASLYPPFTAMVEKNGRVPIYSQLTRDGEGRYQINFNDMEEKAKNPRTKMLLLCSPHNPTGRVWSEEELRQLARICKENNLLVLSDEIHFDFIHAGEHVVFERIASEMGVACAILTAPSKTFNVAGLQLANIILPDKALRERYVARQWADGYDNPSFFGYQAVLAAYREGDAWLDAACAHIQKNFAVLAKWLAENMPSVRLTPPESMYLAWLDISALGATSAEAAKLLLDRFGIIVSAGSAFGAGGEGFLRVNLALPTRMLTEALGRVKGLV